MKDFKIQMSRIICQRETDLIGHHWLLNTCEGFFVFLIIKFLVVSYFIFKHFSSNSEMFFF